MRQIKEYEDGMNNPALFQLAELAEEAQNMRERGAASITTTFASSYVQEVSLSQALAREAVDEYRKQATGQKFLINPSLQ